MARERDKPVVDVLAPGEDLATRLARMDVPMGRPVVVLFGGAEGLEGEAAERLYPMVRDGIMAVAVRFGAAIVDGGTLFGVMALAGRARAELGVETPLIGVVPAGKVTAPGVAEATGSTQLEPHHSHLLLVPGMSWGDESPILLNAVDAIANGKPVVAVIIDGGAIALAKSLEAANRGWPLVAIDGSGRSADLVAAYVRGDQTLPLAVDRSSIHVAYFDAGPESLAAQLASLLEFRPSARPTTAAANPASSVLLSDVGQIEYPALYLAASEASRRGQKGVKWLAATEIGLTLLGVTAVGVLNIRGTPGSTAIFFSVLPLLLVPIIKFVAHSSGFTVDWVDGRAVAETVKSMAWRFMMHAAPYDSTDSDESFARDLTAILRNRADVRQALNRLPARPAQITTQMRSIRALDLTTRGEMYVNRRLIDQADWYRRKSGDSRRWAGLWFWSSLAIQLAAAGSAVLALANPGFEGWLAVVTVLGAASLAGTAWTQLSRYDESAKAYAVALQEVLLVQDLAHVFTTDAELGEFVSKGEGAISREHRLWMAKRSSDDLATT